MTIGSTADDLLTYVRSFKDYTMSSTVPVTIGGMAGRSVDISTNKVLKRGWLLIPEDNHNLVPGEKVRVMVFDLSGSAVMIMVEVPKEKDFEADIAAIQPVLDSFVWR